MRSRKARFSEVDSVESGHLGIGDDQVAGPPCEDLQRLGAIGRDLDVVPDSSEGLGEHARDARFVIDDENALRRALERGERLRDGFGGRSGPGEERKLDPEGRPVSWLALDAERAAMLFDDPTAERQPKAGALAGGFGRKKRLEDPRLNVVGNAGPGIGDLELDAGPGAVAPRGEANPAGRGRAPHCLVRVGHEVHDDLVELMGVSPEHREVVGQIEDDLDVVSPQFVGEQLDRLLDHPVERHVSPLGWALAGEGEEVLDDAPAALGRGADLLGPLAEGVVVGQGTARSVRVVDDEPDVAKTLADLLRLDHHRVDVAPNGRAALEKLRAETYDLVLSDLKMPELDGPGLYETLARDHPHMLRRVVFLTGDALSSEITAFLERAGAPYLYKSFTLEELRRVIQRTLPMR